MKPIKHFLFLAALLLGSITANAYDFEVDGIYYNVKSSSELTVEVTYEKNEGYTYSSPYSGIITLPETVIYDGNTYRVSSIGERAFESCKGLTSIIIPKSVTSIGRCAFQSCSSLTTIIIPESVISIGDYAFNATPWYNNQPDGVIYVNNVLYGYKGEMPESTSFEVREGTVSISERAFNGWNSLTSITLPESITSIGDFAFSFCSKLTSITIPKSVTSIGNAAFSDCSSLTSITIPEGVTSIGVEAFYYCSSLTTVTLPESVKSIGGFAFYYCSRITSIIIPESVTSIGECAFRGCSSLTAINIPESSQLMSIGSSAFSGCSSLTSITIPEGVTDIGSSAFERCSSLTAITIPEGVMSIGSFAFSGCNALQSIKAPAAEPPFAYDNTFSDYSIELCVPEEAMEAYRTTAPWSKFTSIRNLEGEEVEVKQCAALVISYVDGQVVLTCETEGVTFKSSITADDARSYDEAIYALTGIYTITAQATKEGYLDSETVTATLCWVPCDENHGGETTDIITIPAKPVLIQTDGGAIIVNGLAEGTVVKVNDLNGVELGTATATGSTATITTSLTAGNVAIVKIGERSVKVAIK